MKNSKKGFYIVGIIVALVVLFTLLFFMFGGKLLKIEAVDNENVIEVNFKDDNFKYPKVDCEFLGSKVKATREGNVDLSKIGTQEIKYKCKKLTFEKEVSYKYNVIDNVPPEIKLNGDVEISLYVDDKYEEKGAVATDNVDGDITDKIVLEGEVNVKKEGTYELTYTITDSSNLTSSVKRSVVVKKKPVVQTTTGSSGSLGCGEAGVIYLTFDDGPNATYTPVILDVLKKYNVKATFFVTNNGPDSLIKREFEEGHAIGIHSATHDYAKIYKSSEAFWEDMNKVDARITKITGEKTTLLRFPGGVSNTVSKKYKKGIMTQLAKEVQNKGYAYFDWNVSSGDAGGTTDPTVEYKNVVNSLSKKKGNVVLMHDIKKHTSLAIENIIKYGLDNGYTFKVLTNDVVCHQKINN